MHLFDVYTLFDIEPVEGKGSYVYTEDGTEYLDLYGGHAVISIGHSHPKYVDAIKNQVSRLSFYSNSVKNTLQQELAKKIGELSGYQDYAVFFCNSGAEANENAMKLASFITGRKKILAFEKAFHGRTSGAVAATDNLKIQSPFNKTDNIEFVAINDEKAIKEKLSSQEFAAVIIEGIQGVAGIHLPSDEFLKILRKECDKTGTILILDEIQSGYGRTGKFFAHQYSGIKADIITSAKGIANGFPFAAVLISPKLEPKKGMLGTTFGGNHLGCAAAIAVADVIKQEDLIENSKNVGEYLINELKKLPEIEDVRGRGLMIGFEVKGWNGSELRKKLLFDHHIFTGGAGERTVRLLPALSLSKEQASHFIKSLKKIIS